MQASPFPVTRCDPGYVSQTGFNPDCRRCMVDTYSSLSSTQCLPCPLGTQSPSGSDSINDCAVPTSAGAASGAFPLGSEWVGQFADVINGKVVTGGVTLQVLARQKYFEKRGEGEHEQVNCRKHHRARGYERCITQTHSLLHTHTTR